MGVGFAYLCAFLMDSAVAFMMWVVLKYLVQNWYGAETWQLGVLGGTFWVSYVVTSALVGRLASRIKRHHLMALGGLIFAVSAVLVGLSNSLGFVMLVMVLCGIGPGLFWPALEGYFSHSVGPAELRRRIGWFNLSWSGGEVAGAYTAGLLFHAAILLAKRYDNPRLQGTPCFLAAAVALSVVIVALTKLTGSAEREEVRQEDAAVPRSPGRGGHASLGVFWLIALLANGVAMTLRGVMIDLFPHIAKNVLSYSELHWSVLVGSMFAARTVMFVYWQWRHAWEYRARYLFGLQLLLPVGALILIFGTNYWVILLAFILTGVGMSKTYIASIFYSLDSDQLHEHRGGIHEAVLGAGMAFPLLAGLLPALLGWNRSPYALVLVMLLAGIVVQLVLLRKARALRQ